MTTEVSIESVTVSFAGQVVLRDVSLTIPAGTMVALLGPTGSGKTALLWTIAGLAPPDEGTVEFGGTALTDRDAALAAGVLLVPQGNGLASVLTARENTIVGLLATGCEPSAAAARADEALDELGVAAQADQLAEELSGGQRQRVAVARALAARPRLLLADEVCAGLDAGNRDRVLKLLRARADDGAVVVLATHDPDTAAACDMRVTMDDGALTGVERS